MTKLLTSKEAAEKLGVSKSTLARYEKRGKLRPALRTPTNQRRYSLDQIQKFRNDPQAEALAISQTLHALPDVLRTLPPAGGSWAVPNVMQYVGAYSGGRNFYFASDEAVRESRVNARNMLRDLKITAPLQARMLAVAELPWSVEPEDKKDPEQLRVASEIQAILESLPNFLKLRYSLLWAVWYGRYAAQIKYRWDFAKGRKRLLAYDWLPVHGDSLEFKQDSDAIGVLVGVTGSSYRAGTKPLTTEPTDINQAHVLDGGPEVVTLEDGRQIKRLTLHEREAFVVHQHEILAGDFFEPLKAGYVKGRGIRDALYWTWYLKHEIAGWLTEFLERVGTGITIVRYQRGNQESFDAAKTIAESNSNQSVLLFPRDPDGGRDVEDIERIEPSPVAIENMMKVLDDYFGAQIKEYIVGQTLTSEAHATGLGSGVADVHENTFQRLVKFDAINLQETLTRDLVGVIQRWTFPEARFKCKFVIAVDKPNPKEYMEGVKTFVELGGEVDEDEVRNVLGLTKPDAGAKVLGKQRQQPLGGNPFGQPGEDQFGDENEPEEFRKARFEWSPYTGPRGGKGWKNSETGNVVYGDKPGEGGDEEADQPEEEHDRPSREEVEHATKQGAEELQKEMESLPGKAKELAAAASEAAKRLGQKAWEKLPPKVQNSIAFVNAASKKVLYVIDTPLRLGLNLTKEVARQRGLPEHHVQKVARVVNAVDQLSTLPVVGVYAKAAKMMVPAIGPVAGYIPVAALTYVAYSTARDPFATCRAARSLVRNFKKAVTTHMAKDDRADAITLLLEAYEEHGGDDWFDAILHAALDETQDLEEALTLAQEAYEEHPEAETGGSAKETFR